MESVHIDFKNTLFRHDPLNGAAFRVLGGRAALHGIPLPTAKPVLDVVPVPLAKPVERIRTQQAAPKVTQISSNDNLNVKPRVARVLQVNGAPVASRSTFGAYQRQVNEALLESTVPINDGWGGKTPVSVRELQQWYWAYAEVDITRESVLGFKMNYMRHLKMNDASGMHPFISHPFAAFGAAVNVLWDPFMNTLKGGSSLEGTKYDANYVFQSIQRNKHDISRQIYLNKDRPAE